MFTYPKRVPIGQWYSFPGIDSSLLLKDYDTLYVNYWKALEIAEENGFSFPKIEVANVENDNKKYWGIYRINNDLKPQTIFIAKQSGEIIKADYNLITDQDKDWNKVWLKNR